MYPKLLNEPLPPVPIGAFFKSRQHQAHKGTQMYMYTSACVLYEAETCNMMWRIQALLLPKSLSRFPPLRSSSLPRIFQIKTTPAHKGTQMYMYTNACVLYEAETCNMMVKNTSPTASQVVVSLSSLEVFFTTSHFSNQDNTSTQGDSDVHVHKCVRAV